MSKLGRLGLVLRGIFAGAVFAVLGTIFHQSILSGLPFGLGMALFSLLVYAVSLRPQKSESWAFALTVSALVFFFAQDFGQDKLIPATTIGYVWSYGSIAIVLLVAMFPRLRS